jgi:hypothetical protein
LGKESLNGAFMANSIRQKIIDATTTRFTALILSGMNNSIRQRIMEAVMVWKEKFGYSEKIISGEGIIAPSCLWGSLFECLNSGIALSVTVYLKQFETRTPHIKCGIYSDNSGVPDSLIGYTEEWVLTNEFDGWKTFNIISGGTLVSGKYYWLVVWANNYFYGSTFGGLTDQLVIATKVYGSFPVTFPVGVFNNNKALIYCAYWRT